MARDWRRALLAQAEADYGIYKCLAGRADVPTCYLMEESVPGAKKQKGNLAYPQNANLEYPWEEREYAPDGAIRIALRVPAQEKWPDWVSEKSRIGNLCKFMETCFRTVSS